jgi:hypothetical protein
MNPKIAAGGIGSVLVAAAFTASQWVQNNDTFAQPEPDSSALVAYQTKCAKALAFHTLYLPKATGGTQDFVNGEAHRPPELAALYARQKKGIGNSLHIKKLAFDKFIVKNGAITFDVADYYIAGQMWKAIGPQFGIVPAWGGDFSTVDAVHFSCVYEGVK